MKINKNLLESPFLLQETIDKAINSRFPEMNQSGRNLLAKILVRKEATKGTVILEEGEVARNIIIIGKGLVRQFYYKNKKDITEHFSYEGCIVICIESFLKQEPTKLVIEALENTIYYELSYENLQHLIETNAEINTFYRRILEYSLITSQMKADSLRFETARERYNRLCSTAPEIIKRAPLIHIASYLLMTPETLSRVRAGVL